MNAFEMQQFQALSLENMELKQKIAEMQRELLVLSAYKEATQRTAAAFAHTANRLRRRDA